LGFLNREIHQKGEILSHLVFGVGRRKPKVLLMAAKKIGWATLCASLARMILLSRKLRRKVLMQLTVVLVLVVVIGAWPLASWLASNVWLFLVWWGICVFYGLMVILLSLYDMLSVFKEVREADDD
jgi:fatty acid desaturase